MKILYISIYCIIITFIIPNFSFLPNLVLFQLLTYTRFNLRKALLFQSFRDQKLLMLRHFRQRKFFPKLESTIEKTSDLGALYV